MAGAWGEPSKQTHAGWGGRQQAMKGEEAGCPVLPILPLPRKAAVVLAVIGHLPRSIQAYPQGCNTHDCWIISYRITKSLK